METLPPLICLILLLSILTPFLVMFSKTAKGTIGWSIAMHLTTLPPATVYWAFRPWGNNDLFLPGMFTTLFGCTLFCAPFVIYRYYRENKSDPKPQENFDY